MISFMPNPALRGTGGGGTGRDGLSAYELAVQRGYVGTLTQWLASLRGTPGEPGTDGASAHQLAVEAGYVGTLQEWLASLAGSDGASAYDLAVQRGFGGTVDQWLASLAGAPGAGLKIVGTVASATDLPASSEPGDGYLVEGHLHVWDGSSWTDVGRIQGPEGPGGPVGPVGPSAYQVALDQGFVGDEAAWLDSLRGPPGDPAAPGVADETARDAAAAAAAAVKAVEDDIRENIRPKLEEFAADQGLVSDTRMDEAEFAIQDLSDRFFGYGRQPQRPRPIFFSLPLPYEDPGPVTLGALGVVAEERVIVRSWTGNPATIGQSAVVVSTVVSPSTTVAQFVAALGVAPMSAEIVSSGTPGQSVIRLGISGSVDLFNVDGASVHGPEGSDVLGGILGWYDGPSPGFRDRLTAVENALGDGTGSGPPGAAGKSAYEIWLDAGNAGTVTAFLASLIGDPGVAGASAYQVAVANGFVGTEAQWLASLVGPAGPSGSGGSGGTGSANLLTPFDNVTGGDLLAAFDA